MAVARKKQKARKQHSGGEVKKKKSGPVASQDDTASLADAQDGKRGNIGPSGQGPHRGRETRNKQTAASGRPDIPSVGNKKSKGRRPSQKQMKKAA